MGNISIQSSNHYSIITICNYDTYQDGNNYKVAADEQPSSSQVAADEQPSSTTKKENKENKDKKYKAFISLFNEITNRKFKGSDKVEGQFNARLLEGNHYSDFKTAITNARNSKHLKENPEYLTPEYITRPNKLDQWINAKPEKKVIKKQEGNPNSIFPTLEEFAAKGITFDD